MAPPRELDELAVVILWPNCKWAVGKLADQVGKGPTKAAHSVCDGRMLIHLPLSSFEHHSSISSSNSLRQYWLDGVWPMAIGGYCLLLLLCLGDLKNSNTFTKSQRQGRVLALGSHCVLPLGCFINFTAAASKQAARSFPLLWARATQARPILHSPFPIDSISPHVCPRRPALLARALLLLWGEEKGGPISGRL